MAFGSFLGRLLFVSVFVLSAYQEFNEFGDDGGAAARQLKPKFNVFSNHVATQTGFQVPHVEMKHLILGAIVMKSLGSLLFVFGSTFGAVILLLHQAISAPILYDFYNYDADKKEFTQLFVKFTQNLALLGALLYFIGMKNSIPRRSVKKKAPKAKSN
ncbi:HR-like lesion-inducing protein-like protein [Perilla frutescens var. hirtella]|uniref:HR-like lesion-inducing protein-like protein n=1 Tax=Perilla frutescens var. hirtella TaxID=608512 RepID=A0AAD4PBU2_PERFH|nr:HR-like lesion-inducing protein-like protein [Perilla frutescens var. frutescens]KAH6834564.1 HR-like lesion-inducing protein-like protein [Perilla frutescens var. hirtella]